MTNDTAASPSENGAGSPTLDPRSLGCILPVALVLVVFGLAYVGLQRLMANTGPWAIAAAENGLQASGLPEDRRRPFEQEIARLDAALEAGELDSEGVVNGIAGLLDTPTIPLLVLDDVRTRRLPASGLSSDEKASADETLARVLRHADTKVLSYEAVVAVLGSLTDVPEDGAVVALDDDGLRALVARSEAQLAKMNEARAETASQARFKPDPSLPAPADEAPTFATLLERYRRHVDAVLAGESVKVQR